MKTCYGLKLETILLSPKVRGNLSFREEGRPDQKKNKKKKSSYVCRLLQPSTQ
jgi:hypothetical protein